MKTDIHSSTRTYLICSIVFWALFFLPMLSGASLNPFPTYKSIEPNIAFWKKVYAEYPSTMGLIHDSNNLAVIYEVITVRPATERGSQRTNKKKIKKIKQKYKNILTALAAKKKPSSPEEKRVAALFGKEGSPAVWKSAADNIRFQRCLSDRFQAGVVRSGQYLAEIKTIFSKKGLPADLAYLPHVESSFNYEAYSKFGAAGIWQFIRSTGKRFLKISYTLDERRDPIAASHAAAAYLKENYEKLGSWPLALTAYNHGAGSMLKAQNQLGDYENIFNNYSHRRFGFASRNFYPEFLAAREVAKNYKVYFKDLSPNPTVRFKKVTMKGYAPIDNLAQHFNTDIDTIKTLNPALRKPVYSGQKYIPKGYSVKLPSYLKNFDQLASNLPNDFYKNEQKRSRFYRVERGDTAGKIARMHRVSLKDLVDINMLNRRSTIYVGQNLRIPAPGEKIQLALAATPAASSSVMAALTAPQKSTPAPLASAPTLSPEATKQSQQLAQLDLQNQPSPPSEPPALSQNTKQPAKAPASGPGPETPVRTAKTAPQTTPKEQAPPPTIIAKAPPELRAYDHQADISEAEIPAVDPPVASVTEVNPAVISGNFLIERIAEMNGQKVGYVQVEDTETLGHYADWLEIPTQKIRELNNFSFRRQIRTHQQIKIPLGKVGKDLFEERRYEHHKEIEEDFFSAYTVVGIQAYSIKRGDNIWSLCKNELELPFWLIKKYNPTLKFDALIPKQQLTVPVVEKT